MRVGKAVQVQTFAAQLGDEPEEFVVMVTVYRLHVSELNDQFIEAVQAFFKDREVEITVTEVDETAYLLRSEANRMRLAQAISNIENGKNLVEVPVDMLQ